MWEFCIFEIKYRLRHVSTYVFAGILVFLVVFINLAAAGMIGGARVQIMGNTEKVFINSPAAIYTITLMLLTMGIFMMASFMNQMFSKDFDTRFYDILFCKPIKKYQYIVGRLLGNTALMLATIIACYLAFELSLLVPGIDKEVFTQSKLIWYIIPLFIEALPNFYFFGALFIATVIVTKKPSAVFGTGVFLYILLLVSERLSSKIENEVWASLIDPFGGKALELTTKGWTAAESNTQLVGLSPYILWNRLLWIVVSTVILIVCWKMFNFNFMFRGGKRRGRTCPSREGIQNPLSLPGLGELLATPATGAWVEDSSVCAVPPKEITFTTHLHQFRTLFTTSLTQIYRSASFYWITALMLGLLFLTIPMFSNMYGTETLPVTWIIVEAFNSNTEVLLLLIITFFTGELVFKARDHKFNQIQDTLPVSPLNLFLSKFVAMVALLVFNLVLLIFAGVIYQTIKGYYNFELGVYVRSLFVRDLPGYLMLLCLAFLIHNFVNQKYVAHFVFVLTNFIGMVFATLKIEHKLLIPFRVPYSSYSDMAGFGYNVHATLWFTIYWALIAILLTVITVQNWKVGLQQTYTKLFLQKMKSKPVLILYSSIVALILLTAGYIFYNTNIRHTFTNTKQSERQYAQYEKDYSHFKRANQPKVQDVRVFVELHPEKREVSAVGTYLLKNTGDTHIDTLFVNFPRYWKTEIEFEYAAWTGGRPIRPGNDYDITLVKSDLFLGYNIYRFSPSLAPQDTFRLNFDYMYLPMGFSNNGSNSRFLTNGTFFTNEYFPSIGYDSTNEISSESRRKKLGLPAQDLMPDSNDAWGLSHNYISGDDWIGYEINISTPEDQIALAPGELIEQGNEHGRNYYKYALPQNVLHFYAVLSARYEVRRDNHAGIDLEIYYHKGHPYNIEAMMHGLKISLNYYQEHFGAYPHNVLRIAEFPRYGSYAQAFPMLIPFSEGLGFIANLKKNTIDYPVYVTAHETAHQWWAHQVIGGFVRGTTMISEAFAQYSALMVMKGEYSDKLYRDELQYELRQYLNQRSVEQRYELPLVKVENQTYIHYNKGLLVLNATACLLGEDVLNGVLREFLETYKYAGNPYPNSLQFMETLMAVVPDSLTTTIEDMFERIVLYDHKVESVDAVALDEGGYKTTLVFTTEKRVYDDKGKPEIVPYTDWVEIALLDDDKQILHIESVYISGKENTVEIFSNELPAEVYIDPYVRQMDIAPQNNYKGVAVNIVVPIL